MVDVAGFEMGFLMLDLIRVHQVLHLDILLLLDSRRPSLVACQVRRVLHLESIAATEAHLVRKAE